MIRPMGLPLNGGTFAECRSKDEGASTAVAVVPVPVKPVPASDVPASDVVISQELADAEKRGVYNLVTPIPIFQTALTSKRM